MYNSSLSTQVLYTKYNMAVNYVKQPGDQHQS